MSESDPGLALLSQQASTLLTEQRARVDTAKLLVTFSTGVASSLVASALQAGDSPSGLDFAASWALALAFLIAAVTLAFDRLTRPDGDRINRLASSGNRSDSQIIIETQRLTLVAAIFNERVVSMVTRTAAIQFVVSGASGVLASLSMLVS